MRGWLLGVLGAMAFAVLVVAPAGAEDPGQGDGHRPQLNFEAAVFADLATSDRCVHDFVQADVIDFTVPGEQDFALVVAVRYDVCTGGQLGSVAYFGPLTEPDFVVTHNRVGELHLAQAGTDQAGASISVNADLVWTATGTSLMDGTASVVGAVRGGGLDFVLDESVTWNKWGSETFPWAGLWRCRFTSGGPRGGPQCIGQT